MGKIISTRANGSKRIQTVNDKPSLTDQQYKEECDASHVIEKYLRTGQLTHVRKIEGKFADVSNVQDLHGGYLLVQKAQDDFRNLSAEVRKKFKGSVLQLVEFLQDSANHDEAVKLGLKLPKELADPAPKQQGAANGKDTQDSGVSPNPTPAN